MQEITIPPRPSAVRYAAVRADPALFDLSTRELCDLHLNTQAGSYARAAAVAEWKRRMARRVELLR